MDSEHSMYINTSCDVKKVKDYKQRCLDGDDLKPETQSLAIASLLIGVPEITRNTIDEWMTRVLIMKECSYSVGGHTDEDWWPARELVEKHIGMVTAAEIKTEDEFAVWLVRELRYYVEHNKLNGFRH